MKTITAIAPHNLVKRSEVMAHSREWEKIRAVDLINSTLVLRGKRAVHNLRFPAGYIRDLTLAREIEELFKEAGWNQVRLNKRDGSWIMVLS